MCKSNNNVINYNGFYSIVVEDDIVKIYDGFRNVNLYECYNNDMDFFCLFKMVTDLLAADDIAIWRKRWLLDCLQKIEADEQIRIADYDGTNLRYALNRVFSRMPRLTRDDISLYDFCWVRATLRTRRNLEGNIRSYLLTHLR